MASRIREPNFESTLFVMGFALAVRQTQLVIDSPRAKRRSWAENGAL